MVNKTANFFSIQSVVPFWGLMSPKLFFYVSYFPTNSVDTRFEPSDKQPENFTNISDIFKEVNGREYISAKIPPPQDETSTQGSITTLSRSWRLWRIWLNMLFDTKLKTPRSKQIYGLVKIQNMSSGWNWKIFPIVDK